MAAQDGFDNMVRTTQECRRKMNLERARSIAAASLLCVAAAVLAGCASSFPVDRADLNDPSKLRQAGLYYTLPKTVFDFVMPVAYELRERGELCSIEKFIRDTDPSANPKPVFVLDDCAGSGVAFGAVRALAFSEADPRHTYYVNPDLSWWVKQEHSLALDEDGEGTLRSADASMSNEGLKVLVQAAGIVAKNSLLFARYPATETNKSIEDKPSAERAAPQRSPICAAKVDFYAGEDVAAGRLDLGTDEAVTMRFAIERFLGAVPKPEAMAYDDARCVADAVALARLRTEKLKQKERDRSKLPAAASEAYAKQANDELSRRLAALDQKLAEQLMLWRVLPKTTKRTTALRLAHKLEPRFDLGLPSVSWYVPDQAERLCLNPLGYPVDGEDGWCVLPSGTFVVMADAANDEATRRAFDTLIATQRLAIKAKPLQPGSGSGVEHEDAKLSTEADGTRGYRYRLPAKAILSLMVVSFADRGNYCIGCDPSTVDDSLRAEPGAWSRTDRLIHEPVAVAQFGRLVAMPVTFRGTNAKLKLKLDRNGFLSNATIGQDAQSLEAVAKVVGDIGDEKTKRDAARKAAADTEAALPLKSAKDANDLRAEQIRQIRLQTCLDAAAKLPAGAALPSECTP